MTILYNKNDKKEMKALIGFEPVHNGKRMDLLLAATKFLINKRKVT